MPETRDPSPAAHPSLFPRAMPGARLVREALLELRGSAAGGEEILSVASEQAAGPLSAQVGWSHPHVPPHTRYCLTHHTGNCRCKI